MNGPAVVDSVNGVDDANTPKHCDESPKYPRTKPVVTAVKKRVQIMTQTSRVRPRISIPPDLLSVEATPPAMFPMATKLIGSSVADVS